MARCGRAVGCAPPAYAALQVSLTLTLALALTLTLTLTRATCVRCTTGAGSSAIRQASRDHAAGLGFAQLLVTRVEARRVDALDDELGRKLEGFVDGAEGLRRALRRSSTPTPTPNPNPNPNQAGPATLLPGLGRRRRGERGPLRSRR